MVGTTPRPTSVDELTLDESTLKALLSRFVAIPSVSSDPRLRPRCWDAAKFAEAVLLAVGAECKMVQVGVAVAVAVSPIMGVHPTSGKHLPSSF